ncbi:unnamed protein product [Calypogeia fissa]
MKDADFSNLYLLAEVAAGLTQERASRRKGEKRTKPATESPNLRNSFNQSEGPSKSATVPVSEPFVELESKSSHSQQQLDSENEESSHFQVYTTISGMKYVGAKQLGKSIPNAIDSKTLSLQRQEVPTANLESDPTGADSRVKGKQLADDSVEMEEKTGPELMDIGPPYSC